MVDTLPSNWIPKLISSVLAFWWNFFISAKLPLAATMIQLPSDLGIWLPNNTKPENQKTLSDTNDTSRKFTFFAFAQGQINEYNISHIRSNGNASIEQTQVSLWTGDGTYETTTADFVYNFDGAQNSRALNGKQAQYAALFGTLQSNGQNARVNIRNVYFSDTYDRCICAPAESTKITIIHKKNGNWFFFVFF